MQKYKIGSYDITEVQNVMTEMLADIDRICKNNHIRYILDSGTMLGAIRHHGFIPWDDDMDIAMPRDDYEKFINVANKELNAKYYFECLENTREYPYNFGKVRAINTVFEEKFTRNLKIRHCVYIDVFPMDYVNIDNTAELVRKRTWVGYWTQIRYEKLHLVSGFKLFPFRILPIEFINRKAQKNMKYCFVNKGQYVQKLCHFGPNKPPINISMFNDVIKVPFNGYKFNVPKEYDIFLTGRYGNYMELPPLQKQCPSHHIVRIEL